MSLDYATHRTKKMIPKTLWQEARAAALSEGMAMAEWITKAIQEKISRNGFHKGQGR